MAKKRKKRKVKKSRKKKRKIKKSRKVKRTKRTKRRKSSKRRKIFKSPLQSKDNEKGFKNFDDFFANYFKKLVFDIWFF